MSGGMATIRIRAEYGTPEFDAEYQAALTACQPPAEKRLAAGTLTWLIECFRGTAAWQARSESTRAKWDGIYRQVMETAGSAPLSAMTPKAIRSGLERRAHTPGQAQHFLNAMRALFRWAVRVQLVKTDPTAGIQAPARRRDAGIRPWTEEDVAAYEKQWPIGTRQRVWLDVLLYTGLRRGDAVRLGRQHVRDGSPPSRPRRPATDHGDTSDPAGARRDTGSRTVRRPRVYLWCSRPADGQEELRQRVCNRMPCRWHCQASAHGVRKIAATRAAETGATVAELEAIFGWSGGSMAALYTRAADRQRLAKGAMHKLAEQK